MNICEQRLRDRQPMLFELRKIPTQPHELIPSTCITVIPSPFRIKRYLYATELRKLIALSVFLYRVKRHFIR